MRISRGKRVAFGVILTLVSVLGADLVYRGYLAIRGRPASAATLRRATRALFEESWQATEEPPAFPPPPRRGVVHPYFGFEAWPDALGIQASLLERPDSSGRRPVLIFVGGSVAAQCSHRWCEELESLEWSIASRETRVEVMTLAHGGYKQPQQLMILSFVLSLGFAPVAIVNLDGFNEVALAVENAELGVPPVYPSFPLWGPSFAMADDEALRLRQEIETIRDDARTLQERADSLGLFHSAILGTLVQDRMSSLRRKLVRRHRRLVTICAGGSPSTLGSRYSGSREEAVRLAVDIWRRSSLAMEALCRSTGITYLHVLQPTLLYLGSKDSTAAERELPPMTETWQEGVRAGYPLLREEGDRLREAGISFLDLSMLFRDIDETLYVDGCHYNGRGIDLVMERVVRELQELLGG